MKIKYERWVDSPRKPKDIDPAKECAGRLEAMRAADWVTSHKSAFGQLCDIVPTLPKHHLRDNVNRYCIEHGIRLTDSRKPETCFAHAMWSPILRYIVIKTGCDVPMAECKVDHSGLPWIEEACA